MMLKVALAALCMAAMANGERTSNPSYTKYNDISSAQLIDWYTCTAQGNYPDPTTCDHYIACTTANLAYQMPCADRDEHGNKLHYVPDSGPSEQTSYCDWPELVDCHLSSSVEPTSFAPGDPTTPAPITTTTTGSPDPGNGGDCPENVKEGAPCDEKVDCQQCGDCDVYFRCEGNKWVNNTCDFIHVGGDFLVQDKLFWNKGGNIHGGSCVHWGNLKPSLQDKYKDDPQCKPICEYGETFCIRKYTYKDPSFDDGYWDSNEVVLECAKGTKWSQAVRTCVFCDAGEDCHSDC